MINALKMFGGRPEGSALHGAECGGLRGGDLGGGGSGSFEPEAFEEQSQLGLSVAGQRNSRPPVMGTGTSKSERRRISRFASAPNGGSAGRRVAHQGSKLFLHRLSLNRSAVAFRRFESQRFKKLRISIAYTKSTTPPIVKRSPALFFRSVERAELKRCEYQLFTQGSHDGVDRETPRRWYFLPRIQRTVQKIVSINRLHKICDAAILKLLLGMVCTFQLKQRSSLWINTRFSHRFVVRALTKRARTPSFLLRGSCPARIRRHWRLALK
jgi:hypothetical protein